MSYNVKIMGADQAVSNSNGTNWLPSVQCTTQRGRLFKLTYTNLSGALAYLWLFDTATGSAASTNPVAVIPVAIGATGVLDFAGGGKIFNAGLFIAAATAVPASPASTPTLLANNIVVLSADVRVG